MCQNLDVDPHNIATTLSMLSLNRGGGGGGGGGREGDHVAEQGHPRCLLDDYYNRTKSAATGPHGRVGEEQEDSARTQLTALVPSGQLQACCDHVCG